MYSCTVEHLHASFHFPLCQGRWVKLRPCFISSNEDRAKILETVFLLPSKLFCSVPRANWNGLSVNWMCIDVCWDRDIWPTFDTCKSVQCGRYIWFFTLFITYRRGICPYNEESGILQDKQKQTEAGYYSTGVSLHGWVNPSGPVVFAQRSAWTAQEGPYAAASPRCYSHSHNLSGDRIKPTPDTAKSKKLIFKSIKHQSYLH